MVEAGHDHTSRTIRARLFGVSEVRVGTRLVRPEEWGSRGARPLVLYLLLARHHRAGRDEVQERFWPGLELEAGRNALYKAIHAARRLLEPELAARRESAYIVTTPDAIALNDEVTVVSDAAQFLADVRQSASLPPAEARPLLRSALDLYRGELLEDFPYADWPVAAREQYRHQRESATLALAALDVDASLPGLSQTYLDALLHVDPGNERVHRALMRAYLAQDERALVLRQYERCRIALSGLFGVEPTAHTTAIADQARRLHAGLAGASPGTLAVAPARNNLPALPTGTIGRTREVDEIYEILSRSSTRILTIVGGGGAGKTRLGIEAAMDLAPTFADGVAFVRLAPLGDPNDVPGTVAQVLGLTSSGRRPPGELVIDSLQKRQMLLVLDNLEHLTGVAPWIAELIEQCHRIRILATSRMPLRIRAEQVYRIGGLDVPDLDQSHTPRSLERVDAVALFAQSVRAQVIDFRLDEHNAGPIARICVALDGLPLALELAASRVGELSIAEIESQLARPLAILAEGPADLPERQRTLRDTITWSHALLTDDEQNLFRRLGAFAGGAELDALLAVCGDNAEAVATGLVDTSLAAWRGVGEGRRLVMHPAVFEFAAERLEQSLEGETTRLRHAGFYGDLAARAESELRGADQIAWLDRLDRDIQNIRQALQWAIARDESELALRISGRIGWFWNTRGHPREGFGWASQALALPGDPWSSERANTLSRAARCAWFLDDRATHDRLLQEALAIWDHNQDPLGRAWGVNYQAGQLWRDGKIEEATRLQRESMDLFRAAGNWGLVSDALVGLALADRAEGDDAAATVYLLEALGTVDQSGDTSTRAFVNIHLAGQMHYCGDAAASIRYAEEGERVAWLLGDKDLAANAIYECAIAHLELDDLARALELFAESETLFEECDTPKDAALAAMHAAVIRLQNGDLAVAAAGFGQAWATLRDKGWPEHQLMCAETGAGFALAMERGDEALRLAEFATRQRAEARLRRTPFASSCLARIVEDATREIGAGEATRAITEGEVLTGDAVFDLLDSLVNDAADQPAPG